ncbi:MAG: aldo/keto reductase [Rhodospirillales bacterium]|jgi:D-threo-aldose 1-dehydrogenase|nr:aldo/keto reductase [Rhodospirillales bacterium]
MNPQSRRQIGNTQVTIPALGLGGSALGGIRADRPVNKAQTDTAYQAAWDLGFRYFDTGPLYGAGFGERHAGRLLAKMPRGSFVISTKVGRYPDHFDYGFDATLRSIEKSLERLGTDRLDIVFIHDIDPDNHGPEGWKARSREALNGAYPALDRLKAEGVVGALGVGVNSCPVCTECLREVDFDVFMLAGRYTLLDQTALEELLPLCERREASVISAAPFNSGILAASARFNEGVPDTYVLRRISRIEAVCDDFGVSLGAAALQFPLGHPVVAAVTPGPRTTEQVQSAAHWFEESIPPEFWTALKDARLLDAETPVPK